jgi:sigma-B regulation protein RsbU (phosphoserine phosphatase)
MSAAFLMATTQLMVRTTMMRIGNPGQCLEEVNAQLCTMVFNGQFVTLLILVLDLKRGELQAAVAGHYPPLIGDSRGFAPLKMEYQLVLGVEKNVRYPTETYPLKASDCLLLYTDGVLDVFNPQGQRFDHERLLASAAEQTPKSQGMIDHIHAEVDRFRGPQELPDDLTLVAIRVDKA